MADLPARRLRLPARESLRRTSRWVWVLLVLAALFAVATAARDELTIAALSNAILSAVPLIAAAALMYAAPRERLVALSAFAFAAPLIVLLVLAFFEGDRHDILRLPLPDYQRLQEVVIGLTGLLANARSVLGLIAVLALAVYIGPVRSRTGWLIVLLGLALAAFGAIQIVSTWLPLVTPFGDEALPPDFMDPLRLMVLALIGQLTAVASAYLAAAAFDRRLKMLALSYGLDLVAGLIGLASWVSFVVFGVTAFLDFSDPMGSWILAVYWVIGVASSVLLIAGILLELPRAGRIRRSTPMQPAVVEGPPSSGR